MSNGRQDVSGMNGEERRRERKKEKKIKSLAGKAMRCW